MADGKRNSRTVARQVELKREDCGPDVLPGMCRCREAVTRAYGGMLTSGVPDCVALEAAIRVYRYHHPAATAAMAQETVESWVLRGTIH